MNIKSTLRWTAEYTIRYVLLRYTVYDSHILLTNLKYIYTLIWTVSAFYISVVSCQKGSTLHAYAWQIGPFWQGTLDIQCIIATDSVDEMRTVVNYRK